jgi:hypothetical protein
MIDAKPTSGTGLMASWGKRLVDMIRSQKLLPGPGYRLKQHGTSGVQLEVLFPGVSKGAESGWTWKGIWTKGTIYAVNDVVFIPVQYTISNQGEYYGVQNVYARFLFLCTVAPPSSDFPPADPNRILSFSQDRYIYDPATAVGRIGWEPIACYHDKLVAGITAQINGADGNSYVFFGGILCGVFVTTDGGGNATFGPGPNQWNPNA